MDVIPAVQRAGSIGVDYTSSVAIHFSVAIRNYLLMLLTFVDVKRARPFSPIFNGIGTEK